MRSAVSGTAAGAQLPADPPGRLPAARRRGRSGAREGGPRRVPARAGRGGAGRDGARRVPPRGGERRAGAARSLPPGRSCPPAAGRSVRARAALLPARAHAHADAHTHGHAHTDRQRHARTDTHTRPAAVRCASRAAGAACPPRRDALLALSRVSPRAPRWLRPTALPARPGTTRHGPACLASRRPAGAEPMALGGRMRLSRFCCVFYQLCVLSSGLGTGKCAPFAGRAEPGTASAPRGCRWRYLAIVNRARPP